jgi:hypothetical protein
MNNIDKGIKLNIDMCKTEMYLIFIIYVAIYLQINNLMYNSGFNFMYDYNAILFKEIFIIFSFSTIIIAIYRVYSKIYFRSIFGDSSYMYMPMPFSDKEIVLSKIIAGTVITTIPVLLVLILVFITGDAINFIEIIKETIKVSDDKLKIYCILNILAIFLGIIQLNTEIFLAIIIAKTFKVLELKFIKVIIFMFIIGVFELIKLIDIVENPLTSINIRILELIVLSFISIKLIVVYMNHKYEID